MPRSLSLSSGGILVVVARIVARHLGEVDGAVPVVGAARNGSGSSTSSMRSPSASASSAKPSRTSSSAFVPHRRAHQREGGLHGRPARRCREQVAARADDGRRRIAVVVAGERVGEQRRVLDRAREDADRVERFGLRQDAAPGDQPAARLEADDAAKRGRADDRAVGLRADSERHHAGARPPPPSRRTSRPACGSYRAGCASCRA